MIDSRVRDEGSNVQATNVNSLQKDQLGDGVKVCVCVCVCMHVCREIRRCGK